MQEQSINKLHNCPNCGGYLDDNGRCEFCGSKVYDFVNVDFDKNPKTYIRVKYDGNIVLMPVIFTGHKYDIMRDPVDMSSYIDYRYLCFKPQADIAGTLDFCVIGDVVVENKNNA